MDIKKHLKTLDKALQKGVAKFESKVQAMAGDPPAVRARNKKPQAASNQQHVPVKGAVVKDHQASVQSAFGDKGAATAADPSIKCDKKYFDQWIAKLKSHLDQELPSLSEKNTEGFQAALEAVKSSCVAKNDAQALKEKISKQKPLNKEELAAADQALKDATKALDDCVTSCQKAAEPILSSLDTFLSPEFNDAALLQYIVLTQFKAKRAADWCARGDAATASLLSLLFDSSLMRTLLQEGGAMNGQYGRCMEILNQIPSSDDPVLERLKTAVALELAEDVHSFGAKPNKGNPKKGIAKSSGKVIDPLKRYVHYEQAYLFGELDDAFSGFSVWELRGVVNSDAPDDQLGWCRQSLQNYRPDHVLTDSPQWRYCMIVKTDVPYKAPDWYKQPHTYDQILSGGGKCGPRAWYGRFACKAFGIPTWGVRQPGHAAMTRWTTKGWMTCLGAGFQWSWWDIPGKGKRGGLDFLLETEARSAVESSEVYMRKVLRLEWMALFNGENGKTVAVNCMPDPGSPWWALSLMQRKILAAAKQPGRLTFPRRASPTKRAVVVNKEENCEVQFLRDHDVIIIPAATCSNPSKPTKKVHFMRSFLGGQQIHLAKDATVEYTLAADFLTATAKQYQLTCRVCSVHRDLNSILLTVNNDSREDAVVILHVELPYTMGEWGETPPVVVEIGGPSVTKTTLTISNEHVLQGCGFALKDIKLTPV